MSKMDDILDLDADPPPVLDIPIMEAGPFDLALLPGSRVIWHVPSELLDAAAYLTRAGQVVVVTDDMVAFNRRVLEEAGLL